MADNEYLQTVIVLSGGLSHERDVSLRSGRRVSQALRSRGIEVVESDVDSTLLSRLAELNGSVVFPLLHGEAGEDGALREVFELLGVPFVGSVGSACRVAFDKSIATTVVRAGGIRTPTQVALPHETFRELGARVLVDALGDQIGFPMMIKPSRCGSALGCSKVTRPEELPAGHGRGVRVRLGGRDRRVRHGNRSDRCSRRPWQRADRASGCGDSARIGRLRLRRPLYRWCHPVPLPGRGVIRGGECAAPTWLCESTRSWVFGTCPGPTSSSRPTATRSSSKSMSPRA